MQQTKIVMILALAGLSSMAQAEEWVNAPVQKVFKNWQVTCNNLNDCDVRNTDQTPRIIIKRKAGPEAQPSLVFLQQAEQPAEGIILDGKTSPSNIPIAPTQSSDDFKVGNSESLADIQQWVKATQQAHTLALAAGAKPISLEGLNAALKLADQRQGRVNNQTALLEPGTQEASKVPAPPAPEALNFPAPEVIPVTNHAELVEGAIATNGKLLKKLSCQQDEATQRRSYAEPLNDKQALVFIDCGREEFKSYNVIFVSSRDNPKDAKQLTLPLPLVGADGKSERKIKFANAGYDTSVVHLYFSDRGNETANCGSNGGWRYDGKTFHLARFKNQPTCDGVLTYDWPSVWMTEGSE